MTRWFSERLPQAIGNQVFSGRNRFTWEEFDRLPPIIKRVLAYAPIRLGTARATAALKGGASAEAVARVEIAMARRFSRQETLELYGPDHPSLSEAERAA